MLLEQDCHAHVSGGMHFGIRLVSRLGGHETYLLTIGRMRIQLKLSMDVGGGSFRFSTDNSDRDAC